MALIFWEFPKPLQAFEAAKWQILRGISKGREYDRKIGIINVLLAESVSRKSSLLDTSPPSASFKVLVPSAGQIES